MDRLATARIPRMVPNHAEPEHIARIAGGLPRHEIAEFLRAVDLFERCGHWSPEEARAWREEVRARDGELLNSVVEP